VGPVRSGCRESARLRERGHRVDAS
jgi:hypothetical protein